MGKIVFSSLMPIHTGNVGKEEGEGGEGDNEWS
jgi:hypothetical protein